MSILSFAEQSVISLALVVCNTALFAQRIYHPVALRDVRASTHTHICTVGSVVYRRLQKDGDWHITLDDGTAKVVVEIIPLIPLPVPTKGDRVKVCGIRRVDEKHGWAEIHPAESIEVLQ